jgi:hypothetical protein
MDVLGKNGSHPIQNQPDKYNWQIKDRCKEQTASLCTGLMKNELCSAIEEAYAEDERYCCVEQATSSQ